ncbi:AAEL007606-PA [Aedes aegypti]|uniref:AAEL007606-PA n=1 Tax=Aedes aegypti TaxID=7159 RepID=Q171L1_AEDAE|nr:AAEL007606-PA [Aedes aegypti]
MAVEDGFVTRQQTQLRKTSNSLLTIKFLETLFGANKLRAIIQTTIVRSKSLKKPFVH